MLLGVDTGGTFTDFILLNDNGELVTHKVLSTPRAPEQAILQGMRDLGVLDQPLGMVHGSTVATNAVLEGKGVSTVYITNYGLADVLSIGRQTRRQLYQLQPEPTPPPVAQDLCLETGGRLTAQGDVLQDLSSEELTTLIEKITQLKPQAVAINLLFSYLDDRFEQQIAAALPNELFVSRSSQVLAEYKEYERGITTWLNSYVGPLVEGYLHRLQHGCPQTRIAVMQSSGGTIAASQAGQQAVHMLLSGPAGGLAAAKYMGEVTQQPRLLTFDMGGTSTDVALIDGDLQLTSEGSIAGYPVAVPMVDMHTIGAGGGSIASIDLGGMLQVGPASAGADPGPACYGRGGSQPTVSDANLVLGRLQADAFLGGQMRLDVAAAREAIDSIAYPLDLNIEQAAEGIIRIANEHMAHALRVMSVQRGIDPRQLTLVSFGGAGGLHVCALAEALDMREALVPRYAGVLSALGMLVAPRARQLSRTVSGLLSNMSDSAIQQQIDELALQGVAALQAEGVAIEQIQQVPSLDLRYQGQAYTLNCPWQSSEACQREFHARHEQRYGHQLDLPVELVNVRIALKQQQSALQLPPLASVACNSVAGEANLYGIAQPVRVYAREELSADQVIVGPALITETVSTTYLAPNWNCRVDHSGCLILRRG